MRVKLGHAGGVLHDRSSPKSGRPSAILLCRIRANKRHMHCSKLHRYSITSSAVAMSDGGTVRPSVPAVLRLITSSNLVGA